MRIEPTTCRVYSHTLVLMYLHWPQLLFLIITYELYDLYVIDGMTKKCTVLQIYATLNLDIATSIWETRQDW